MPRKAGRSLPYETGRQNRNSPVMDLLQSPANWRTVVNNLELWDIAKRIDHELTASIGRCGDSHTFVSIVHNPTGVSRGAVVTEQETRASVSERLLFEICRDLLSRGYITPE
jgi:hypothetical protein